jgi:hypothetical protein
LDIAAGTSGIFGRAIDISGCNIGFQATGNQSDLEMRIADSSLCHVQAADNILAGGKYRFSFFRPNVTPSLGDFDPSIAPITALSQVAGVSPIASILNGNLRIVRSRQAYLSFYATANDESWSGADSYLGGLQVYGADTSGTGAGLKAAIRCQSGGPSQGTTRWAFTGQSAAAADSLLVRMDSDRLISYLPVEIPSYTIATLPAAATFGSCIVMITNPAGNKRLVFSDGTIWRYPDGTAV